MELHRGAIGPCFFANVFLMKSWELPQRRERLSCSGRSWGSRISLLTGVSTMMYGVRFTTFAQSAQGDQTSMSTKKNVLLLVTVLLVVSTLWIGAPRASAQGDPVGRTITVTGYGTAYGAPDIVMVGLGVESVNVDIKTAMDDTTTRMNAVMQALQDNGVAREDIRTEQFSIWQDYGYGPVEPGMQSDASYRVTTSVTITVRDVDRVGELLAVAVDAGANIVNYIQFDIEDRDALQAEARGNAVTDAQARAEHLAGLLGMAVGKPLEIVESGDYYGPMYGGGGGGGGGYADAAPISEGQLSVNMQVTITFALVPAN